MIVDGAVEGGGSFFIFLREWGKKTKKVGWNVQGNGVKPSRKWGEIFKEMG
jgi:hypothetical protein